MPPFGIKKPAGGSGADETDRMLSKRSPQGVLKARKSPRSLYQPLDASQSEIRLLKVHPRDRSNDSSGNLECSLETVQLNLEKHYRALSYAWKLSRPRQYSRRKHERFCVKFGAQRVEVGENLHEALSQIQGESREPQTLWVDALCINQKDKAEVNQQVRLMNRVYSSASAVIVWLGAADDTSDALFEALHRVSKADAPTELLGLGRNVTRGLRDLLCRDWWTRVWVVQEATLGRRCIARCGSASMDFREMVKVLSRLATAVGDLDDAVFNEEIAEALDNDLEGLHRIVGIFEETRNLNGCPWARQDMLSLLSATSTCEASNWRDHVYGVLGLLPESLDVQPDYGASVEEVFEAAAVRIMQWMGSTELLRALEGRESYGLKLPSWVPTFHKDWGSYFGKVLSSRSQPSIVESNGKGRLKIMARFTDRITAVGVRCTNLDAGVQFNYQQLERCRRTLLAWWDLAAQACRLRSDKGGIANFWRLLLRTTGGAPPVGGPVADDIEQASFSDPTSAAVSDDSGMTKAVPRLQRWLETGARPSDEDEAFSKTLLSLCDSVADAGFFVSRDGGGGLVRAPTQVGDHVAFLGNAEQTFVLREAGDGVNSDLYKVLAVCTFELLESKAKSLPSASMQEDSVNAEHMVDLLQASEVYQSKAFFKAVRLWRPGHESPFGSLDCWRRVRQAVQDCAYSLIGDLRDSNGNAHATAHVAKEVEEDLRWVEGPASAGATLEQLTHPRVVSKPAFSARYCRVALARYAAALQVWKEPTTDIGLECSFASVVVKLARIVLARGYLQYAAALQRIPAVSKPEVSSTRLDAETAGIAGRAGHMYMAAVSRMCKQQGRTESGYKQIVLV